MVCPVINTNARTPNRPFARHVWEGVEVNGHERERCSRCKALNTIGVPPEVRFWDYVDKNGPVKGPGLSPCWLWTGYLAPDKYGRFSVYLGGRKWKHYSAHGYAWFMKHGALPVPPLTIDHMCHEESCVQVDHMRELAHSDNVKNKEFKDLCKNGHLLVGWNAVQHPRSRGGFSRRCRICRDQKQREYRRAR